MRLNLLYDSVRELEIYFFVRVFRSGLSSNAFKQLFYSSESKYHWLYSMFLYNDQGLSCGYPERAKIRFAVHSRFELF